MVINHTINPTKHQTTLLSRWRLSTFWVMLVGYIGYYLCRGNISAALPLLSREFHYTNTQLGLILTFSELSYALGKLINGPLADKVGGKKIFLFGMLGAIVFNLLFTKFQTILMFTVIWSLCRYFLSMGWGGVVKIIGSWYEPKRNGTIMGFVSINFQLGSGITLLYCSLILYLGYDWKALFIIPAITLFVIFILSALLAKDKPQDIIDNVNFGSKFTNNKPVIQLNHNRKTTEKTCQKIRIFFANNIFRYLVFFSFVTTMLRSILMFWTAKLLADLGMNDINAILNSSIFPFLGIIGTIFLGWYTDNKSAHGDRTKAMGIMLCGLVFSVLIIAILIPYRLQYQSLLIFFIGLSGFFLYGPYSMTSGCLALDIAGAEGAGTCTGVLDGIGYLGSALALWTVGWISDTSGWSYVFYLLTSLAIISAFSCFRMSLLFRSTNKIINDAPSQPLEVVYE